MLREPLFIYMNKCWQECGKQGTHTFLSEYKLAQDRSNCQHPLDHWKSKRGQKKNIYFCFIDYGKAFMWITTTSGKFLKRWQYQTTLPASWEICVQVKKQQSELDMEQQFSQFSSVQLLSRVWLFATPWIIARRASLSITNSWSSLRLMCHL